MSDRGEAMAVEEPKSSLVLKDGAFEVRDYPGLVVAQVTIGGDRNAASNAGFRLLAGYIFGGNSGQKSIAMTAPVAMAPAAGSRIAMTAPVTQSGESGQWTVQFTMPSEYTLDTLPVPNDQRVQIKQLPPARIAVLKFSGLAREPGVAQKAKELETLVAARGLTAVGAPSLARYDPPWTPWFMRRNEMMVPVAPK